MACYESQLGNLCEAKVLLGACIVKDKKYRGKADRVHEILFNTQEPDHRLRLAAMESPHTSAEDVINPINNQPWYGFTNGSWNGPDSGKLMDINRVK